MELCYVSPSRVIHWGEKYFYREGADASEDWLYSQQSVLTGYAELLSLLIFL